MLPIFPHLQKDFDITSLRDPTNNYGRGLLIYHPNDVDFYVFYNGMIPLAKNIDELVRGFDELAEHAEYELSLSTASEADDRTHDDMYKITYSKIKCYKHDDRGTVHIVYNNIELILTFADVNKVKEFIETLPKSAEYKTNEDYQKILMEEKIRLAKAD